MKIIVFDLDGTLALDKHRVHHLRGEQKNWAAYFDACENDAPCTPLITVFEALHGMPKTRLEIWTGRVDSHYAQTLRWIERHMLLHPDLIKMRPAGDRTNDDELKRKWLHEARERGDDVILVFEDRKRVVEMWRAEGVVCAQVAPGEF